MTVPVTSTIIRAINRREAEITFGVFPSVAARAEQPLPSYVSQYPASRVSSACSCLDIPTGTATVLSTATVLVSQTVSVTTTSTETILSTATTLVRPLTIPEYTYANAKPQVSVATVTAGSCTQGYDTSGNGVGNTVISVNSPDKNDCCAQCQARVNCVANAFIQVDFCQLLLRGSSVGAVEVTDQCPLGTNDYPFVNPSPNGRVFAGPCGF